MLGSLGRVVDFYVIHVQRVCFHGQNNLRTFDGGFRLGHDRTTQVRQRRYFLAGPEILGYETLMLRDYLQLPTLVRILCLGSLINRAGSFVMVFLAIYASEQLGQGVQYATACMGVFGLGAMLGSMIGGQLADQIGRRYVMLLSLVGGAGLLLIIGQIRNPWAFMLSVGLFALVSDMYRPAASAMIADVVPNHHRPHAFALMYISINLGFAIAPTVGGFLAEYSYKLLFWGDALTMASYGLIIAMFVRETKPDGFNFVSEQDQDPGGKDLENQYTKNQNLDAADSIPLAAAVQAMIRDLPFVGFCSAGFLMALVFLQCVSTLPIYIKQCGFSNAQFGMLMSVNGAMIVVLQLPATHWLSRFNPVSLVIAGGVLIAIGFGCVGFCTTFLALAVTVAIWTIGEIIQSPFTHAIITDIAPEELRARYLGLHAMCGSLAITIGAPVGGVLQAALKPQVFWGLMFVVAAASVTTFLAIHRAVTARVFTDESGGALSQVLNEQVMNERAAKKQAINLP